MNKRNFELARKLSYKSNHHHKLGAVLTKRNKPIGFGFNQVKSHPKSPHPFKSIHAEFDAILNSKLEDFTNCAIYIYRETPGGKIANSKPCKHCEQMLKSLNIDNIYYSDSTGFKKL